MSQAAKVQEPSMEEILASIRRIIADDEGAKPKAAEPAAPPASSSPAEPPAMNQDEIDAMLSGFDSQPEDPAPVDDDSGDVLELTEAMEQPAEPAFRTIEPNHDVVFSDPRPEPPEPVPLRPAAMRSPPPSDGEERALLSDQATNVVSSAFGTLAHTVLVQNARTLDDLVREMLRPMLKSWLDDNLPNIVERLVRAEIERVSRGRG